MESFLIKTAGGPDAGTRVVPERLYSWPLPDELAGSNGNGVYVKVSESQLPPQAEDSNVIRGAEYEWKENGA